MAEIGLHGGPSDGLALRTSLPVAFLWVKSGRAYRAARSGAALYERRGDAAFFVGGKMTQCVCGAFRMRERRCPFCGASVAAV